MTKKKVSIKRVDIKDIFKKGSKIDVDGIFKLAKRVRKAVKKEEKMYGFFQSA